MIDELSLTSVYIQTYFENTLLGPATGFVFRKNSRIYLATNWHVVTGRNAENGKLLSKNGSVPDSLVIWHHKVMSDSNTFEWVSKKVALHTSSDIEGDFKKWFEHPKGSIVDVVLLPIEESSDIQVNAIPPELTFTDMLVTPAMHASIIGFPFGRSAGGKLPMWVSGFVASEPDVDIDGLPLLYVNAPGSEGLSGSPVFIIASAGSYRTSRNNLILDGLPKKKFLGVYSGRMQEDSDVCRIWKPIVLDQIIEKSTRTKDYITHEDSTN